MKLIPEQIEQRITDIPLPGGDLLQVRIRQEQPLLFRAAIVTRTHELVSTSKLTSLREAGCWAAYALALMIEQMMEDQRP